MDLLHPILGLLPGKMAFPELILLTYYIPDAWPCKTEPIMSINAWLVNFIRLPLPSLSLLSLKVFELTGMNGKVNCSMDFGANEDAMRDGSTDGLFCSIFNPAVRRY
jgi:hypothetical protein